MTKRKRSHRCVVCKEKKEWSTMRHLGHWRYVCKGACEDLHTLNVATNRERSAQINVHLACLYEQRNKLNDGLAATKKQIELLRREQWELGK